MQLPQANTVSQQYMCALLYIKTLSSESLFIYYEYCLWWTVPIRCVAIIDDVHARRVNPFQCLQQKLKLIILSPYTTSQIS